MELKDYVKIIAKHKVFIIVIALLVAGLASFWQYLKPTMYSGAITMSLTNSPTPAQNDDYNNYYTINATLALIQSFEALFASPNFINEIYQDAGVNVPASNVTDMAKIFKTSRNQISSSNLVVSTKSAQKEELTRVLNSAKKLTDQKILDDKNKKYISDNFNLDISDSLVLQDKTSYPSTFYISLIGGLILGILGSFVLEYFRE